MSLAEVWALQEEDWEEFGGSSPGGVLGERDPEILGRTWD